GLAGPPTGYALAAGRHLPESGTASQQLAEVAVARRRWAQLNPRALMRDPLTVEDVLASRLISWPLHLLDCCLVTDAGGAVVVTSAERARDCAKRPVYVLGTGEASTHVMVSQMPDFARWEAARMAGERAFAMAGVTPADIDVAQVYDAFTIVPIMALEALGFCKEGEGGAFVSGQRTAAGGASYRSWSRVAGSRSRRRAGRRSDGSSHCRAKRISVSLTPSMERVQTAFARPAPSSVTDWKSSSSRSALQLVPPVQIGPLFTGRESMAASGPKVAPPSVLSR